MQRLTKPLIMSIFTNIATKLTRKQMQESGRDLETYGNVYLRNKYGFFGRGLYRKNDNYKDVIFFQFVKLIGTLFADVDWTYKGSEYKNRFDSFVKWFDRYAFATWKELCYNGYVVIMCINEKGVETFKTLKTDDVTFENLHIEIKDKKLRGNDYFVMTSEVFDCFALSDYDFLSSYLSLANKYMNNSDLAIDGNGHILLMSPVAENQHTSTVLDAEQKAEWEKDFKKDYAKFTDDWVAPYFSNRPMSVNDIDLTNFDTANFEKLIKIMLIICGHFDLPANQIPLLETSASKGLTTGNELMIGDTLKYKTFERILRYFAMIPEYFNMDCEYTINNNPNDNTQPNTNGNEN